MHTDPIAFSTVLHMVCAMSARHARVQQEFLVDACEVGSRDGWATYLEQAPFKCGVGHLVFSGGFFCV